MRRLRNEESGFTLVELLVAMSIGTVVLLATFMLLDAATPLAKRTADRVDANQRGRLALEIMAGELRSQVCLPNATPPILPTGPDGTATGNSGIWFYKNTGNENALPQLSHIYLQGSAIKEDSWQGVTDSSPANKTGVKFTGAAASRTLIDGVALVGTTPLLRYYGFDANLPAAVNQQVNPPFDNNFGPPASVSYVGRIVQVNISFSSRPAGAAADSLRDAAFQQSVYFRTADATDPSKGAKCD
jgi:prepilin-type N-terminal cleavage/methylation domain-containing protein